MLIFKTGCVTEHGIQPVRKACQEGQEFFSFCSPGLGLQACAILSGFTWMLGIELMSSYLYSKHFTDGAISPDSVTYNI